MGGSLTGIGRTLAVVGLVFGSTGNSTGCSDALARADRRNKGSSTIAIIAAKMSAIANHTIGFSRKLGSVSTTGCTGGFGGGVGEPGLGVASAAGTGAGGVWVGTGDGGVPNAVLAAGGVVSVWGMLA